MIDNARLAELSLEESHDSLHKLHKQLACLERENSELKRKLQSLETTNADASGTSGILLNGGNQRDLINSGRQPNLLRCIIDSVGDLIYVKNREGAYLACNTASEKFIGLKESEQVGKTDFDFFDREFAEAIRDKDNQIFSSSHEERVEEWVTSAEGKRVLLDSLKAPFYGSDGTVAGLVGISRDITERKLAEAKIEQLNSDLTAHAVELENANLELEAFNYSVSHDLRRPLTIILGYCDLIEELYGQSLDTECRGYLGNISDGVHGMNQLIDSLLKFSIVMHTELHREDVDLSRIAVAVASELALSTPGRRVTFRISEGITVNGDAALLRVVLENVFGNAWKYTGKQEETVIEFGMTAVEGIQTCFVRDNGTGFDMAHADQLFKPFQRLPGTEAEGHGIGLATVERIIKRHGGRIWAEGEPGKGATFYFTL
jgi:PAS domain S-box-containing protein